MMFRPSGGILYHLRAWREGRRWQEFNRELAEWLESWRCPRHELVIIGASGGYTLPTAWLKKFESTTAYDLDWLAPPLFRLRHAGVRVRFRREDMFWRNAELSLKPLQHALARHSPGATILFSNILGQLLLERRASETEWTDFLTGLRSSLEGRHWASYHDQFTQERGEIIDHLMSGDWKRGLERREFRWPLGPDSLHIIEAVRP